MGSVSKPDTAFVLPSVANPSKTKGLEPVSLDEAYDRLATGCWRGQIPTSLSRGISDDYHETDDGGDWRITLIVPAYTRAVGLRALGVVEIGADTTINAALKYSLVADAFTKQLVLTQGAHGADASIFDPWVAWSRDWVSTLDTADPAAGVSSPLVVPVSNEPQETTIYLEAHSSLDFYIVAVQPYIIPHKDTAWPTLP
jgi:hypothetical protein|tara:strand:+ start:130 stop:726 length:597 start_codon:yes stop_codon:yes gene_type:complete